jgi:hypothetical protein
MNDPFKRNRVQQTISPITDTMKKLLLADRPDMPADECSIDDDDGFLVILFDIHNKQLTF